MDHIIKHQRNATIDTAKGFLMLCVVAGHVAGWPHNLGSFFYYFHLQTFFFISGYLFNYEKYKSNPIFLVISRTRLYIKYLCYVLAFIAFHNMLTRHGFNGVGIAQYGVSDYFSSAINSLLVPSEPLAGAMWFIPALLIMQGIVYAIIKVSEIIKADSALNIISVIALFLIGFYLLHGKVYTILDYRYLTFLPFFYAGFLVRNVKIPQVPTVYVFFMALMVLLYALKTGVNMSNYYGINPFELLSVSFFGVLFCLSASSLIAKTKLSKPLEWVGERTIHILALHFLGFKIATLVLSWAGLVGEGKIYDLGGGIEGRPYLAIIYLIAGVALPVLSVMAYDFMKIVIKGSRRDLVN